MFSGSQFDANSAFGGGGFMTSQSTQYSDGTSSQAKSRETQGLVPVTVKQISEASHSGDEKSNFIINGADVTNVTMIGMVFDKVVRTTDVSFNLDDGTGRIGARRWVNEVFDTREMDEIQNGMYVRVHGHLKTFQNVRQLVAFSVRPVTNFDEVAFHFIDCIHNHLQSKQKLQTLAPTQPTQMNPSSNSLAPPNTLYGQFSADGLKDCDKLVLDFLNQHSGMDDERGVHVNDMARELKLPVDKIMLSLKTLGDDGLVYSTIDDFHYKQA